MADEHLRRLGRGLASGDNDGLEWYDRAYSRSGAGLSPPRRAAFASLLSVLEARSRVFRLAIPNFLDSAVVFIHLNGATMLDGRDFTVAYTDPPMLEFKMLRPMQADDELQVVINGRAYWPYNGPETHSGPEMFTIYFPTTADYPGEWVARRFVAGYPDVGIAARGRTREEVLRRLVTDYPQTLGMAWFERSPGDDPVIAGVCM